MLVLSGVWDQKIEWKLKKIGQMEPDSVSFCEQSELVQSGQLPPSFLHTWGPEKSQTESAPSCLAQSGTISSDCLGLGVASPFRRKGKSVVKFCVEYSNKIGSTAVAVADEAESGSFSLPHTRTKFCLYKLTDQKAREKISLI